MMSLLTRFALLSSIIYFAVPGASLPRAGVRAATGAGVARLGLPPIAMPRTPPELGAFGRAIGFNPHGLQKLRAQLARTTLPTAADRERAARNAARLYEEARNFAAVAARAGGAVGDEAQTLWRHRRIVAQIGHSLDQLEAAKNAVRESAQEFSRE